MGLEMGSDLTRIERQQAFINATLRQILSAETLADPTKTFRLINAALGSLSADPAIANPGSVAGLAWSLREIEKRNIIMTEVPVYDITEGGVGGLGSCRRPPRSSRASPRTPPPDSVVLPAAEPSASPSASGARRGRRGRHRRRTGGETEGDAGTGTGDTAGTGDTDDGRDWRDRRRHHRRAGHAEAEPEPGGAARRRLRLTGDQAPTISDTATTSIVAATTLSRTRHAPGFSSTGAR